MDRRLIPFIALLLVALPLRAGQCLDASCDDGLGMLGIAYNYLLGQSFVFRRVMPLERIELRIQGRSPWGPVVIRLHEGTLDGPEVPGSEVSVDPNWLEWLYPEWVPFTFDEPVQLVAGQTYVIDIQTATGIYGMMTNVDEECYTDGTAYTFGSPVGMDLNFRTYHVCTVGCQLECVPASGTLPLTVNIALALTNNYPGQFRRMAGNFGVRLAEGTWFGNLRSGACTLGPGESYPASWNQNVPALGSLVGDNEFRLLGEDVTPAPYNQPPYPPSGDTASAACTVTGIAP